jgi:hypothetical protein
VYKLRKDFEFVHREYCYPYSDLATAQRHREYVEDSDMNLLIPSRFYFTSTATVSVVTFTQNDVTISDTLCSISAVTTKIFKISYVVSNFYTVYMVSNVPYSLFTAYTKRRNT